MVVSRHAYLCRAVRRGLESNPTGCFYLHLGVILRGSQENEKRRLETASSPIRSNVGSALGPTSWLWSEPIAGRAST